MRPPRAPRSRPGSSPSRARSTEPGGYCRSIRVCRVDELDDRFEQRRRLRERAEHDDPFGVFADRHGRDAALTAEKADEALARDAGLSAAERARMTDPGAAIAIAEEPRLRARRAGLERQVELDARPHQAAARIAGT